MGSQPSSLVRRKWLVLGCLLLSDSWLAFAKKSASRWHLQRIVQRKPLTPTQVASGERIFDLSTLNAQPVTVYVIDSGIRIQHEEFVNNRATYGVNIQNPGSLPTDCDGHGTHVAALAVGAYSGVATNARVVSVRVLDCLGKGSCSDILSALEWVIADHRKRPSGQRSVAVMSVGSANPLCAPTIQATQYLWDAGVVITAAAGNNNTDACDLYPARNPRTLAVGATDINDRIFRRNNHGDCIDVFGPGVDVLSAWGEQSDTEWKTLSGSSMAAPIVAGMAAAMLGADPELSASDVRHIIISSSSRNRILTTTGNQVMTGSVNRLVYAPWSRLFDEVEMNALSSQIPGDTSSAKQTYALEDPDWNSSTSFIALSMTLRPRTSPAMYYAVVRITFAISSAAGIRSASILPRRGTGVQTFANGTEPGAVSLVFYIPMLPFLIEEYKTRLVKSDKNGKLAKSSGQSFSFAQGSLENALLINVTVPNAATSMEQDGGDRFNEAMQKTKNSGLKITLIAVGSVLSLVLLVVVVVLVIVPRIVSARERREAVDLARRNSSIIFNPLHAASADVAVV